MTLWDADRTLNIAHRGASAAAPQNTMAAFELAAGLGADAIECDVRFSADGVPVVIHDATVDATTDGTGRVAEMTLSQLKALDAGAGERIPTLEEVLAVLGERLLLNIELKGFDWRSGALERAVVGLIERYGLGEHVLLSSFNPLTLRRVQQIAPWIPVALIYSAATRWTLGLAGLIVPQRCLAFHPAYTLVDERRIAGAQQRDFRLHVWTVDDPLVMRRLIADGVHGIITNVPDVLRDSIQSTRTGW